MDNSKKISPYNLLIPRVQSLDPTLGNIISEAYPLNSSQVQLFQPASFAMQLWLVPTIHLESIA